MNWTPILDRSFTAAQFAAYCKTIKLTAFKPQFTVVHNTFIPNKAQWHDAIGPEQRLENLVHLYRDEDHWHAGPHLFVADNLIWVFTPLDQEGVHSPSWNDKSWGVETVGNFEVEAFDPATEANLISALVSLHRLGNLDPMLLRFHKEDPETSHKGCPGKNMIKGDIIARVKAALAEPYASA